MVRLREETTIGRDSSSLVCLAQPDVSRHHAVIRRKDHYYVVVDLGSANGTFVNKVRLHQFVPRPLYDNDEITICSTRLQFRAEGDELVQHRKTAGDSAPATGRACPELSVVLTGDELAPPSVSATMDVAPDALGVECEARQSNEDIRQALERLLAMVKVSSDMGTVTRTDELLDRIMASIFDIFPHADRACVLLRDRKTQEMVPVKARKCGTESEEGVEQFPLSRTIIDTVVREKRSVLSSDAQDDDRFKAQQSIVTLSIRSLMCAPFVCKNELVGVITIDTLSAAQAFTNNDLAMLTGIAAQAAIAIKNAELYEEIQAQTQIRTQLSRYLSPDVVEGVLDGRIPVRLGGERKRGTVLFCDIVGFTSMSENLPAVQVVDRLNRMFRVMTKVIADNGGTLHKFGGDMVMAFWNVMLPDPHAETNAVRAALQLQSAVWSINLGLAAEGQRPIHVGIGCNTGELAGGNIGGHDRMEYTVIGDNVNLSQRIESLAGRWQVFTSQATYEPARELSSAIGLPPVRVKGKREPIKVYSIRGTRESSGRMLLAIPVAILTPDGNEGVPGMLTSCDAAGTADATVELVTGPEMVSWETLVVKMELSELGIALHLNAKVRNIERLMQESTRMQYSRLTLGKLTGDAMALALLRPGTLLESNKSWERMRRA